MALGLRRTWDGKEDTQAVRDCCEAASGGCPDVARPECARCDLLDGVTEVTYYRWRREYGGLKSDQVKRLKALETENARLHKAVSDLTLDKLILQEAARGNF
jgi:putative transposase